MLRWVRTHRFVVVVGGSVVVAGAVVRRGSMRVGHGAMSGKLGNLGTAAGGSIAGMLRVVSAGHRHQRTRKVVGAGSDPLRAHLVLQDCQLQRRRLQR